MTICPYQKAMADFKQTDLIELSHDREHSAPILTTSPLLEETWRLWSQNPRMPVETFALFREKAPAWFKDSKLNALTGLDEFPVTETIMGVNHYLDNLLLDYGIDGVQVLEHDYTYYWRLDPNKVPAVPGKLDPRKALIISMPFAGLNDIHPYMDELLDEALTKGIPVHIDAAWITAARDITFNFDHPAIQSVAMSLSKGMALWQNRVGIRWTRETNPTDSITIYNQYHMIPVLVVDMGLHYIQSVAPDHLWNTYEQRYNEACKALYLRPTKMIHLAQSLDRSQTFAMKRVLE